MEKSYPGISQLLGGDVIALSRGKFDRGAERVIGTGGQSHVKNYAWFSSAMSIPMADLPIQYPWPEPAAAQSSAHPVDRAPAVRSAQFAFRFTGGASVRISPTKECPVVARGEVCGARSRAWRVRWWCGRRECLAGDWLATEDILPGHDGLVTASMLVQMCWRL